MRGTNRLAALAAAVGAFGLAVVAGGVSPAMSGSTLGVANSHTYEDATGEAPSAPDIAAVVVSNDDNGLVSFAIRFANRSVLGPTEIVWVSLNTDPAAGEPRTGFDYDIEYWRGNASLWKWDAESGDWVVTQMVRSDWAAPTLTLHVNTSELAGATVFGFVVTSDSNPDDPEAAWDTAPEFPFMWLYLVDVHVAPQVSIGSIACTPNPAVKGKTMVGRAPVTMTRGAKPEALPASAKVKWTATLGAVRLNPTGTKVLPGGVLTSTWKLPKATKAKSIRITLTVTVENVTVTKTHVHRVK